jgi:hypothetical protein
MQGQQAQGQIGDSGAMQGQLYGGGGQLGAYGVVRPTGPLARLTLGSDVEFLNVVPSRNS